MMIVIALLAATLAIAWPAVRHTLSKSQLREAAKQVRTRLTQARLAAIETGQPQQFRFQPGTGRYIVGPWGASVAGQAGGASLSSRRGAGRAAMNAGSDDAALHEMVEDLGLGVVFEPQSIEEAYRGGTNVTLVSREVPPDAELPADVSDFDDSWSPPIIFYPNGRSSNATVRLRGERDFQVDISLRGVMGTVDVAAPVRVSENTQGERVMR